MIFQTSITLQKQSKVEMHTFIEFKEPSFFSWHKFFQKNGKKEQLFLGADLGSSRGRGRFSKNFESFDDFLD